MPMYGNQWFKDDAEYKRSTSRAALRTTTGSIPEVAGLRRGFNGIKPRTSAAASPMTVTLPNGDVYTVKGTTRRSSGNRKPRTRIVATQGMSYVERLNRFGAIGNVD